MIEQNDRSNRVMACVLIGCCLSLPAYAQEVKPDAIPQDPNAESVVAMKDTVQDPRIEKSLAAQNGIWKAVVPPVKMGGRFDGNDPIGLVAGQLIRADCSLNWTDPDSHKLYCFTSATSLVYFLNAPHTYLSRAERNWRILKGKATS